MAILINDNLKVGTNKPVDDRSVQPDIASRDAIPAYLLYIGLLVTVTDSLTSYIWDGTDWQVQGDGEIPNIDAPNFHLLDGEAEVSVDWDNKILYDDDNNPISWANGFIYASAVPDNTATVAVGGVPAGTLASSLKTDSIIQVLDAILFPTLLPTYTIPTLSIGATFSGNVEVGNTISQVISTVGTSNDAGVFSNISVYKNGSVLSSISITATTTTNVPDQFGFSNPNNPNHNYSGSNTNSLAVPLGNTTYFNRATYQSGLAKNNNKGITDTRTALVRSINAPQAGDNTLQSSTVTVAGIYPYFWGISNSQPTASGIASSLGSNNKVVALSNGSIAITFAATGEYIWFAIPHGTAKTTWFVNALNNGSIGGSTNLFGSGIQQNFNSPSSFWSSINYDVYISNFATTTTGSMTIS